MGKGTLEVFLLGANGIKNTDFIGKADPYAIINCWTHTARSKTAKRQGSNPVWNEKFQFQLEEGITEVFIKLYDEDRFTGDDFIGSAKVPLGRVLAERNHPVSAYDVIRPSGKLKGQVKLGLTFIPNQEQGQDHHSFRAQS